VNDAKTARPNGNSPLGLRAVAAAWTARHSPAKQRALRLRDTYFQLDFSCVHAFYARITGWRNRYVSSLIQQLLGPDA